MPSVCRAGGSLPPWLGPGDAIIRDLRAIVMIWVTVIGS